jgi:CheY-like chemotaxis protein
MSETRSSSSPAADKAAPAIAAPPLSPADAPLCFVVDEDPSIRHFLSLILHGSGIDTMEFAEGKQLREALAQHLPDLVFYNIAIESVDAVESMIALGNARFRGPVQLMSNRGGAVLEHVKSVGAEHLLSMLPVLKKPFETDAIVKIIHELRLGTPPSVAARLGLDEALANDWIEFWYQPKINLRRKQLAGAEAYARAPSPARHRAAGRLHAGRRGISAGRFVGARADERAQDGRELCPARH